MPIKNRYVNRSRISEHTFRQIVRLVAVDLDASQISRLTGLSRNSINRYVNSLRQRIAQYCEAHAPFSAELETDKPFFGAGRINGKRGRGVFAKAIVFGINGQVYTEIVPECSKAALQAVAGGNVILQISSYSDRWRGYNGVVDVSYGKQCRFAHEHDQCARGTRHINGIEGFWGYAKTRLVRFRGMRPGTFYLHLKECEFRFNHRGQDLYRSLLKLIRDNPLKLS